MIYSGSGSNFEFLEFWIRILFWIRMQPMLFMHIWTKNLKFNKKEESTNYISAIFYFIVQYIPTWSYSTHRPEFTRLKLEVFYLVYGSGTIILDPGKSSGSMRIGIHVDPDPQHCFIVK